MFSAAKDIVASKAAKTYINGLIKTFGRVEELSIDSKRQRIDVMCQLNGEVSPIGITIESYQVEKKDGKIFITVLDSSATRPWIQAAMRQYVHGREFEVPSWGVAAL